MCETHVFLGLYDAAEKGISSPSRSCPFLEQKKGSATTVRDIATTVYLFYTYAWQGV